MTCLEAKSFIHAMVGGPGAVVKNACLESQRSRVRALLCHSGFKEKNVYSQLPIIDSVVGNLRGREVAFSTSDRQGTNCESCVWRAVSSHSFHHPQELLLAQFSLYVHKSGITSHSFIRGREVAFSASDRQGTNCESCVWRAVPSHSFHHPQELLLAQFSLYVHKSDIQSHSFIRSFFYTQTSYIHETCISFHLNFKN